MGSRARGSMCGGDKVGIERGEKGSRLTPFHLRATYPSLSPHPAHNHLTFTQYNTPLIKDLYKYPLHPSLSSLLAYSASLYKYMEWIASRFSLKELLVYFTFTVDMLFGVEFFLGVGKYGDGLGMMGVMRGELVTIQDFLISFFVDILVTLHFSFLGFLAYLVLGC